MCFQLWAAACMCCYTLTSELSTGQGREGLSKCSPRTISRWHTNNADELMKQRSSKMKRLSRRRAATRPVRVWHQSQQAFHFISDLDITTDKFQPNYIFFNLTSLRFIKERERKKKAEKPMLKVQVQGHLRTRNTCNPLICLWTVALTFALPFPIEGHK